ncbi:MAG: prepilin-type N-terminal cleavage/methylation domain-containing protein [Deltaproteobacteria bacterium]|nr:prepilin-type N-terminal cleavage/methylation domain-containing protein [Deltaproteobacteria bacterium]
MRTGRLLKNQQGFTLIEIIAVLILLGILAAVAVPKYMSMQDKAKEKSVQGALAAGASNVTMAYSKFLLDNSKVPTGISGNAWTDGAATSAITQDIETDLGDFTASYSYDSGVVTVTLVTSTSAKLDWMQGYTGTATKTFTIQQ